MQKIENKRSFKEFEINKFYDNSNKGDKITLWVNVADMIEILGMPTAILPNGDILEWLFYRKNKDGSFSTMAIYVGEDEGKSPLDRIRTFSLIPTNFKMDEIISFFKAHKPKGNDTYFRFDINEDEEFSY